MTPQYRRQSADKRDVRSFGSRRHEPEENSSAWHREALALIEKSIERLENLDSADFEAELTSILQEFSETIGVTAMVECNGTVGDGVLWFDPESTSIDELRAWVEMFDALPQVNAMTTQTSANGRTAAIVPNPPGSFARFMMILASEKDGMTADAAGLCELMSLAVSSARWRAGSSREPAPGRGFSELVTSILRIEGNGGDDSEALREICELARSSFALGVVSYWSADGSMFTLLTKGVRTAAGSIDDNAPSVEVDLGASRELLEAGHMLVPLSFFGSKNTLDHPADAVALIVPTYGPGGVEGVVSLSSPSHREWSDVELRVVHAIVPSIQKVARRVHPPANSSTLDAFNHATRRIGVAAMQMDFQDEEAFLGEVTSTMIELFGLRAASVWKQRDGEIERTYARDANGHKKTGERRVKIDLEWVGGMYDRGYGFADKVIFAESVDVHIENGQILTVPLTADRNDLCLLAFVGGGRQEWGSVEIDGVVALAAVVAQTLVRFAIGRAAAERLRLEKLSHEIANMAVAAQREDIDDVYRKILVRITDFFGLSEAQAWSYLDNGAILRSVYRPDGRGQVEPGFSAPNPMHMPERGWAVIRLGQLTYPYRLDPPDTKILMVSYRPGLAPHGVLVFVDPQNRVWNDDEISYMQGIAATIGQLWDRMTLVEVLSSRLLEHQRRSQQILHQITATFIDSATLNVSEAMVASLEQVRSFIDCDSLALFELDHVTLQIECSHESTRDGQMLQSQYAPLNRDDPVIARVLDPADGPNWSIGELFGTDHNSVNLHVAPVVAGRDILALSALDLQGNSLDEESARMLASFTDILSQFRARLVVETNVRLRTEGDRLLREVASDFVARSIENADEGIYEAMERVGQLHACRSVGLWEFNDETGATRRLVWMADGIDDSEASPGRVEVDNPALKFAKTIETAKLFESPAEHWGDYTDTARFLCVAPIREDGEVVGCFSSETFRESVSTEMWNESERLGDLTVQEDLFASLSALVRQLWKRLDADRALGIELAMADLLRQLATFLTAIPAEDFGGDERALGWLADKLGLEHLSLWTGVLDHANVTVSLAGAYSSTGAVISDDLKRFVIGIDDLELSRLKSPGVWAPGEAWSRAQAMIESLGYRGDRQAGLARSEQSESDSNYFIFSRDGFEPITDFTVSVLDSALALVSQYLARARAERSLLTSFAAAPIAVSFRTMEMTFISCNAAYEQLTGRTAKEMVGTGLDRVVVPEEVGPILIELDRDLASGKIERESNFKRPDGTTLWVDVLSTVTTVPGQTEPVVITYAQDRTERRRSRQLLEYQASHDELTGLPNRRAFVDQTNTELARSSKCAVIMLDLDRFKDVNDLLGHSAGDQLLIACSDRIRLSLRPGDAVARLGGDEFAVLLRGPVDPGSAGVVAERLLRLLREPVRIDNEEVRPSASVGIAIREEGDKVEDLLRYADAAMYEAKGLGRDQWVCFDQRMREAAIVRLQTETDLGRAVENGQLEVYYQPEFDLRTGAIVGAEALLRWIHPEQGVVPASGFLSIAEETGLIVSLGRWALGQATMQAAEWLAQGHDMVIRVNISARQLRNALVGEVQEALAAANLPTHRLCLELTETTIMDDVDGSAQVLQQLRKMGVKIAVDDFGTGYSSLPSLKRLPLDILKIDRAIVAGVSVDLDNTDIMRSIVGLAEILGLDVVAEGIENESQLAELVRLGCHRGQGFHAGRPAPANEIDLLLGMAGRLE